MKTDQTYDLLATDFANVTDYQMLRTDPQPKIRADSKMAATTELKVRAFDSSYSENMPQGQKKDLSLCL